LFRGGSEVSDLALLGVSVAIGVAVVLAVVLVAWL
jgi:hypothetical protein